MVVPNQLSTVEVTELFRGSMIWLVRFFLDPPNKEHLLIVLSFSIKILGMRFFSAILFSLSIASCQLTTTVPDVELYVCPSATHSSISFLSAVKDFGEGHELLFINSGSDSSNQLKDLDQSDFYPSDSIPILAQIKRKGFFGETLAVFSNGNIGESKDTIMISFFYNVDYDEMFFSELLRNLESRSFEVTNSRKNCT